MKTSAVLTSLLLSSFAVAAPVDRRALAYHTEIVTETVVVYTTVYDDDVPEAAATSAEGAFYEQPASSAVVLTTSSVAPVDTPAPVAPSTPAAVVEPTSVYTPPPPPPQTPTPTPTPTPAPAPAPAPEPATTAAPVSSAPAYVEPAPAATSAAPEVVQKPVSEGSTSSGEKFSDVDITIYDNNGGFGACGTVLHDSDMIVALAQPAWGASTYDVMTGASTNPWCGKKINVEYKGNTIEATIMDLCPGCVGHDIDLSLSAWKALTGLDEKTRLKASWSLAA